MTSQEIQILQAFDDLHAVDTGDGQRCVGFTPLMRETGLSREQVQQACRSLRSRGYAEFWRGLMDPEDGEFKGSGYGMTKAGREALGPPRCDECDSPFAEVETRLCAGCEAYREHTHPY